MTTISLARSSRPDGFHVNTPGKQPAVFLDRDGVLNSTDGFVNSPEDLDRALLPQALAAVARLSQNSDYPIILVTNQAGIDMGKFSPEQNQAIQERLAQRIEEAGGRLDSVYVCPNGKKFQVPEGEVDCRKPDAGMFFRAAQDYGDKIDLADSFMVGDMTTDIGAGKNAGATAILVKTGFGGSDGKCSAKPDHVADDLGAAVDWILSQKQ
ncbi:MAG: HAD-IIIA family hydrolase [Candidatus Eremiobacteraeota bacterium]|nr:HAD-IIIA family hydrolase [Candidatus Eremiobacteraeota bacterium]MCW5870999.1 HAD-IIIA family hydrolase [Candidatus Eremiobacteraeota bacterium]